MPRGGTRRWTKLRNQVVIEEPDCRLRVPGRCTGISTTADHWLCVKLWPELEYERSNLQGACMPCNRFKAERTPEEFLAAREAMRPPAALDWFELGDLPDQGVRTVGVTLVTGPPCSGKSTYVDQHRHVSDVVIDLDTIAQALGYPADHVDFDTDPDDDHAARNLARDLRTVAIDEALAGNVDAHTWIIAARPHRLLAIRVRDAGCERVDLDPGLDECLDRAAERADPESTRRQIRRWYDEGGAG